MPAKQKKFNDLREQLESELKQKERSEELSQKMEEEHLQCKLHRKARRYVRTQYRLVWSAFVY